MISCEKLSKTYRKEKYPALDELNLEISNNTVFGFLGPNGAGKTTTIKILTGLMSSSSGVARIADEVVGKDNIALRKKIGYLGQEPKMYSWMKGRELLCFTGELFGLTKHDRTKRADYLLDMAGLSAAANKRISAYSGGMLQRLGIAQALTGKPEVLLLDEPTSSLDPIGRKEVLDFIVSLKEKCSVFMSTHILADVERVCDKVAIINKGKLIAEGATGDLRKQYAPEIIELDTLNETHCSALNDLLIEHGFNDITVRKTNTIAVKTGNPAEDKKRILKISVENNIDIMRFELVKATLEDVFVKLIGGGHE